MPEKNSDEESKSEAAINESQTNRSRNPDNIENLLSELGMLYK